MWWLWLGAMLFTAFVAFMFGVIAERDKDKTISPEEYGELKREEFKGE